MNRAQRRQQKKRSAKNHVTTPPETTHAAQAQTLFRQALDHHQGGHPDRAIPLYEQALEHNPEHPVARGNLGAALLDQGRAEEALTQLSRAVAIQPDYAIAHANLGNALRELGRPEEAIGHYERAIQLQPDQAAAHANLGGARQDQGRLEEAVAAYERAIAIQPDCAEAHFNLSTCKKYTDIHETEALQTLLATDIDDNDRIFLHFALGKALSDLKNDAEAFHHYQQGNRRKRTTIQFDISDSEKTFKRFQHTFDATFFESRQDHGCPDDTPIFILGMPRSGSTLIEQILASHPRVHGAGELPFIKQILMQRMSSRRLAMVPYTVSRLKAPDSTELGRAYIEKIRKKNASARFITDKMPENFLFIGAIRLLLPRARIIHSVRSPEDTCLSIFRTRFSDQHDYAYDLTELGRYYRLYQGMMRHWKRLFPDVIHDCHYERLTRDPNGEIRKLLAFCGLDFDEKCLKFHQSGRNVSTASNYQVRQPLYTSSIAGWKRFEKQLQPLIKALEDPQPIPSQPG